MMMRIKEKDGNDNYLEQLRTQTNAYPCQTLPGGVTRGSSKTRTKNPLISLILYFLL